MANKHVIFYNQSNRVIVDCVITEEQLDKIADKIAEAIFPDVPIGAHELPYETEVITDVKGNDHTLHYNPFTYWKVDSLDDAVTPKPVIILPTSYVIDQSVTPWVVEFDNNTTISFPDYGTTTTVYGIGYPQDFNPAVGTQWPLPVMIMRMALGHVDIPQLSNGNGYSLYWAASTKVGNPINDSSKYDFTKALYNQTDVNAVSKTRQQFFIKAIFELGIFDEADILSLGAIKK